MAWSTLVLTDFSFSFMAWSTFILGLGSRLGQELQLVELSVKPLVHIAQVLVRRLKPRWYVASNDNAFSVFSLKNQSLPFASA